MVSVSKLGLVSLRLDNMDFVFANTNIVATEDATIAEPIGSISEGLPLTAPLMPIATTVVALNSQ